MNLPSVSRAEKFVFLAAFGLIVLSRVVAVFIGRDPGFDQAMVMSSFPLASFADYFRPLPLFEQGSSLGSIAQLDLVSHLFGTEGTGRFAAMRVWSAVVACTGYFVLYRILRRSFSWIVVGLILILIASPTEIILFTTNDKNYVNEFLCACLMIWAGHAYLDRPDSRRFTFFVGVTLLTCVFALTAPLILAATGGGMLVALLARMPASEWLAPATRRTLLQLVALGLIGIVLCGLFYVFYTKPITVFQNTAYANRYELTFLELGNPLSAHNLNAMKIILRAFHEMAQPAYFVEVVHRLGLISHLTVFHVVTMTIALIGFPAYWKRSKFLAGGLAFGILTFLILNLANLLPILQMRYFMFFTPFAVPCFAMGLVTIVEALSRWLHRPSLASPAIAVVTLAIGGAATIQASDLKYMEVSEKLALIDRYQAPLWLYYGAQPSVRALRPDLLTGKERTVLGLISHDSVMDSWTRAARDELNFMTSESYYAEVAKDLEGQEPVWLLLTHYWPEERDRGAGLARIFAMAEADGRQCRKLTRDGGIVALCTLPDDFPNEFSDTLK